MTDQEAYDEIAYYTIDHARTNPVFIHQYAVDAYAAQYATQETKPVKITFALIGLYLHIEKNYSGKEVQLAHMALAKKRKDWPVFKIPNERGAITLADVLRAKPGEDRDNMINEWCVSVWEAWRESQQEVRELVQNELGVRS